MDSACLPRPWIKPLNSHITTSLLSYLSQLASSILFYLSELPNHYPSTFPTYYLTILSPFPPSQFTTLTPFPPSQFTTLPLFPPSQLTILQLTILPTTNRSLQDSNVLPLSKVWLIVRQLPMTTGWWDHLLAPKDFAKQSAGQN